jgi:lysophospholipase L1-like esterase
MAMILFIGHFAAADVVSVACVGDSITFGYGLQQSYPAKLGRWLGTNYDVRNFGVSATTLLNRGDFPYIGRPAYTNALAFQPDIVVIDFGANDSKHPGDGSLDATNAVNNWRFKSDFISDYKAMMAAFQKAKSGGEDFHLLSDAGFSRPLGHQRENDSRRDDSNDSRRGRKNRRERD